MPINDLKIEHTCEECGNICKNDVCFCESCVKHEIELAEERGYDKGYGDATKELNK